MKLRDDQNDEMQYSILTYLHQDNNKQYKLSFEWAEKFDHEISSIENLS